MKRRDNGNARLDRWTFRLSKADLEKFLAVNVHLTKLGLTDGTRTAFFRHLLDAAYSGIKDMEKQLQIQEALQELQAAQTTLEKRKARVEALLLEVSAVAHGLAPVSEKPAEGPA